MISTARTQAAPVFTAVPAAPGATPLGVAASVGFSVGMIGDRIFRDAPALLLLMFMTNYLAIPPALAGLAIFVPKLLIIFVDPLVGTLSDRLNTPWGRRRPLMLIGAFLASAAIVLFFHVPHFASTAAQAAYMSMMVLVGFTGYSLYSVPYLVMASEIGGNDDDRRRMMSWRVGFMAVAVTVSAYAGGFAQGVGGGFAGYALMGWVYGGICLLTMLATVLATAGVPIGEGRASTATIAQQFALLVRSKRYLRLLLVGFLQKLAEGVGYGSFAYFCTYVVDQPLSGIGLVVMAASAGQIVTQPLWLRASRRWAPTTLYTVGVLGWCVNLLLWLAMKGRSEWWLIPLGLQGGFAAGGFLMVTLAMLSNTMAADAAASGENHEGVYSGLWLACEKLGFALGALVVGVVIGWFGFVEASNGAVVTQSSRAVTGIAITYCGINIVIYALSILAIRRYARFVRA
jgi:GPH family glycoside/pentoside/hexuronide:cation symporter